MAAIPIPHLYGSMTKKRDRSNADNPFNNRPEDVLNSVTRAGVGLLPVIGSVATEFLNYVMGNPAQERRDDFIQQTYERLVELEQNFDQLDKEALKDNEQFQATFVQAARLSSQTASVEKKRLLQNAIINSAMLTIDETLRQMLMQFLDRITPTHAAVLDLFKDPSVNEAVQKSVRHSMGDLSLIVEAALPSLRGNQAIANHIVTDLESMGLLSGASLNVMMSSSGLIAKRSTPLGDTFLTFIADPDSGRIPDTVYF
jgi:hypothetical protein